MMLNKKEKRKENIDPRIRLRLGLGKVEAEIGKGGKNSLWGHTIKDIKSRA